MEKGVYINGNLRYRSTNFEKCAENAIDFLYNEWLNHKEDSSSSSIQYISAVREITNVKDNFVQTTYNGNTLEIKPIEEKYLVRYAVEFEESADLTDEDWISKELRYICYANNVRKIYTSLRKFLELEIQVRGFKSFDEMLGDEIECLQDTDETYEIYDKEKRAFHIVTITQLE